MNVEQYRKQFIEEATDVGYTEQNIKKCLDYAEVLILKGLPVVYNMTHFSVLVGYNKDYLRKAVSYTPKFYRKFEILKKNGTKRQISEPLPSLKDIQLWILENILNNIKVSPFAKAYVRGVSLKQNLVFHKGQPKVFTLDVQDFFSSIKREHVELIFLNLGYSQIISNLISKLCTKDESLPQGAPTSPYLSNIYFRVADDEISAYCKQRKINYTRYADDLTFSGNFDEKELFLFLEDVISKLSLKVNSKKTRLMIPGQQQKITGVVVNEKLQVPFKKRNDLRKEMYYIINYGIEEHKIRRKITQRNYLDHILGQVNFVLYLNSHDEEFKGYKAFLQDLKSGAGNAGGLTVREI